MEKIQVNISMRGENYRTINPKSINKYKISCDDILCKKHDNCDNCIFDYQWDVKEYSMENLYLCNMIRKIKK